MAAAPVIEQKTGFVQTVDNSFNSVNTFSSTFENGTIVVLSLVSGHNSGSSVGGGYLLFATFKVVDGGITQVGTTSQIVIKEDIPDWDATIDTFESTIRIRVRGADTVDWSSFSILLYSLI